MLIIHCIYINFELMGLYGTYMWVYKMRRDEMLDWGKQIDMLSLQTL